MKTDKTSGIHPTAYWTRPDGTPLHGSLLVLCMASVIGLGSVEFAGNIPATIFSASVLGLAFLNLKNLPTRLGDWMPIAVPVYAILTMPLSDEPVTTLRVGIIALLTGAAPILLVRSISAVSFVRIVSLFLAGTLPLHFLLGNPSNFPFSGIMDSKNYFATRMAITMFAGAFLLTDRRSPWPLRVAGLATIVLAQYGLQRASSAGAVLSSFPALVTFFAIVAGGQIPGKLKGVIVATSTVVLLVAVSIAVIFRAELTDFVLTAFSKDAGLTGRNILWNRAAVLIAEHPWLGTGYGAFWVQGHLEAEGLWRAMGIGNRAGFHFHNLYYNMLVEVGFLGLAIAIVLIVGTAAMLLVWAVREGSPTSAFFFACHLSFLIRSYAEVDFMVGFGTITFLVNCSWAFGFAYVAARRRTLLQPVVIPRGRMILNQSHQT